MATSTRSHRLLVSAGAAALAGTALATLLASNIVTPADADSVAADKSLPGANIPICHTAATTGQPNMMLRLAQTEVPRAEMSAANSAPAFADIEPPLWAGLGSVTYKITTANERAQAYFDQGLRLAYAFNHGEAQRAFRKAERLDPDCAMCFCTLRFTEPAVNTSRIIILRSSSYYIRPEDLMKLLEVPAIPPCGRKQLIG